MRSSAQFWPHFRRMGSSQPFEWQKISTAKLKKKHADTHSSAQGALSPRGGGRTAGGVGDGSGGVGGVGMARPRFDNAISVMENFEGSEIRKFLRWANYCMTDALQVTFGSSRRNHLFSFATPFPISL